MDSAAWTVEKKGIKHNPCREIICYRLIVTIFCSSNFWEWFSNAIFNENNTGRYINSSGFKVHHILKFSKIIHVTVFKKVQTKATQIRHTGTQNSFYYLITHRKETGRLIQRLSADMLCWIWIVVPWQPGGTTMSWGPSGTACPAG